MADNTTPAPTDQEKQEQSKTRLLWLAAHSKHIAFATVLILILVIGLLIAIYKLSCSCKKKSTFMNNSPHGYVYDTEDLRFLDPENRLKAKKALIREMSKDGVNITLENLAGIVDKYILRILDVEDEDRVPALKARLVIMIDPDYQSAYLLVNKASRTQRLDNDEDRQLIYDLLVKYFKVLDDPITMPLKQWSDRLLIRTFRTLEKPKNKEFGM